MKIRESHWAGVGVAALVIVGLAWGETLEMVTYYPTPAAALAGQNVRMRSLGVGAAYNASILDDGEAAVSERLGVGTDVPAARLDVRGGFYMTGGSGDVNGDGMLSPMDVLMIVNWLNAMPNAAPAMTPEQLARADVDGDGYVGSADAQGIIMQLNTTGAGRVDWETLPLGLATRRTVEQAINVFFDGTYRGRVQIGGGPNPAARVQITAEGNGVPALDLMNGGTAYMSFNSNADDTDSLLTTMNRDLRLDVGTANVGVGVDAPEGKLHVGGSAIVDSGMSVMGGNGDVNGDGVLAPMDALMIVNYINGGPVNNPLTEAQRTRADVTGDGNVTRTDVTAIIEVLNLRGAGVPMTAAERAACRHSLESTLDMDMNSNVNISAAIPPAVASPNGLDGNLNVNDVWIRSANGNAGAWVSTMGRSVTGTYQGTGAAGPRAINVGFRPSKVEVYTYRNGRAENSPMAKFEKIPLMPNNMAAFSGVGAPNGLDLLDSRLNLTDTGFTVGGNNATSTNQNSVTYDYVAYR